jgi:hypothetical protein
MSVKLDDSNEGLLASACDAVTGLVTGSSIPAPIKKNALKAFGQLCTAAIDIPVAHLEGIAAEKRAETQGRVKIISTGADQIAKQMDVDPEYARVAVKRYGQRIVREQVNLDKASEIAAHQIHQDLMRSTSKPSETTEIPTINEDWLNSFEKEASQKSTEEMQLMFGRILAGEIQQPSSFSIRTIKLLGQLDSDAASLFRCLCSMCVSLEVRGTVVDARVPSLGGNAASNALQNYGLSFGQLNILHEYELIISDYNSFMDYRGCVANENNEISVALSHQNHKYGLVSSTEHSHDQAFNVHGVALSRSGIELLRIVDIESSSTYTTALIEYFMAQNLQMVGIS